MSDFNLSVRSQYSTMTDDELDGKVRAIKSRLPHTGYRLMKGCLQSEGYHVQWERVKASMHRVDTAGILDRLTGMGCVVRRVYSVCGPRHLQHIDTNHKLIRYNIVIFGGIDGFSRKIMYLKTATNNRAATAFDFFMEGVMMFGWPYKVRADQGVENVDIARAMFTTRGTGHGSFISGKSVHNQRIERLWRDVWTAVTHVYYDVLHSLEDEGLLDLADSLHLFCVHFVFVPRLQQDLEHFAKGWDDHSLRTERGRTPNQLWHLGLMENPVTDPDAAEGMQIDDIDWDATGFEEDPDSGVVVPDIDCPLDQAAIAELRMAVQPTAHSVSFGRDIYLMCVRHTSHLAGRV
ncbi:uncharacterized protein [Osmerus mordax]|uniref:uncharacterized protein n=1 Tax=Osmerus mordax TaxID=8014 RepID=UPI00350EB392